MNPDVAGLPSKRLSAMGWANAVGTNMDIKARAESMKFEVAPDQSESEWFQGYRGYESRPKKTCWNEK